jgi:transcription termination factor Rho
MSDIITGILKRVGRQQFVVRTGDRSYRKHQHEIRVSPELARQYALSEGAAVTGQVKRKNSKARLVSIETLGGMETKAFGKRPRFSDMVAIDPHQRFELGLCGNKSMRIIDLIAPIGKGTR